MVIKGMASLLVKIFGALCGVKSLLISAHHISAEICLQEEGGLPKAALINTFYLRHP
jgi:hypothetical protein